MTKKQEIQWYRENAKIVYDFLDSKKPFSADYTFEKFAEDFYRGMSGYPMSVSSFVHVYNYMNCDLDKEYGVKVVNGMLKGAIKFTPRPA